MSDPILANLTASDKLLLSQAIYQIGTNKDDKDAIFIETAAQLDQHALISLEKKKFFTPQNCLKVYEALMMDLEIDPSVPYAPASPQLLRLARKYYMQRVVELHNLMQEEQDRFKISCHEIAEIQAGKRDHELTGLAPLVDVEDGSALPPVASTSASTSIANVGRTVSLSVSPAPENVVSTRKVSPRRKSTSPLVAEGGVGKANKKGKGKGRGRGSGRKSSVAAEVKEEMEAEGSLGLGEGGGESQAGEGPAQREEEAKEPEETGDVEMG